MNTTTSKKINNNKNSLSKFSKTYYSLAKRPKESC